jgi:Ca2+:H+ antiporter
MPRWLYAFLIFTVAALILAVLHVHPLILFVVTGLGILPLAALIGEGVDQVSDYTGERIGGLLFATFGNITELIISLLALRQGLVDVVRAAIIGSILGNTLLMLGVAVCAGGIKHGRLSFPARSASRYASLLAISLAGLVLPTVADLLASRTQQTQVTERAVVLSTIIAILLLIGYLASILFSVFRIRNPSKEEAFDPVAGRRAMTALKRLLAFRRTVLSHPFPQQKTLLQQIDETIQEVVARQLDVRDESGLAELTAINPDTQLQTGDLNKRAVQKEVTQVIQGARPSAREATEQQEKPVLWRGLLLLAGATVGIAVLAEILVSAINPVTVALHWNAAFVGLVFVPLLGGLPDYYNTVVMALNNRIGIVLSASVGSSVQIALLVAPLLVVASLFMLAQLDLVFSVVELAVLGLAAILFSEVVQDGELVWLEGLLLILLYGMMASTVFLFGS